MKPLRLLLTFLITVTLNSCSAEDPLPTSGENSFFAKLNGKRYVAENTTSFPARTHYGIEASVYENNWLLTFHNSSNDNIYIYIYKVNDIGIYPLGRSDGDLVYFLESDNETSVSISDGTGSFFGVAFTSGYSSDEEFIKITQLNTTSIIGEFDKITLTDPENPDNKTILTDGKFNINTNTLNQPEP
mgnify:CR=1 FL=1